MAYWIWSIRPEHYSAFVRTGTFAVRRQGRPALARVRPGDRIFAYLPKSRVLAGLFEATSGAFEDATALVAGGHYPHRVRVRPLVALFPDAWVPYDAFATQLAVLNDYADRPTPELRFRAVVQQVVHPLPNLDGKVLEFLVRAREGADQEAIMAAYERLKQAREAPEEEEALPAVREAAPRYVPDRPFDRADSLERLVEGLAATDPIIGGGVYMGPVLDMKWLSRHPFWPDANPQSNAIPMILGNTRDETRGFFAPDHPKIVGLGWDNLAERMAPELRMDIHPEWVVSQYRQRFPDWSPERVFYAATTAGRSWPGQVIEADA
ncbi:MAG TPA: hypothetical protein VD962_06380, partial [Rubricoccaceae bacterium]|nr:hypothetical protein [Rubricoccaceae bacterium]